MSTAKGSKTDTLKAVTTFAFTIVGINLLFVFLWYAGLWAVLDEFFLRDSPCGEVSFGCVYPAGVLLLLVYLASYSFGIILGFGAMRWILRIPGNYLGTFAYALIGAALTPFILVPHLAVLAVLYPPFAFLLGVVFAVVVGVASGFVYFKQKQGFSSWIGKLGVVASCFFLIIALAALIPFVHYAAFDEPMGLFSRWVPQQR